MRINRNRNSLCIAAMGVTALVVSAEARAAAISYTSGSYTQNFDALATSGTSNTWTNGTTVQGWHAATDATSSITSYTANTGSTTTAALNSFGVAGTNAVTERALGYSPANTFTGPSGTGKGYIGMQVSNGSGSTLSAFTLGYRGEQWRQDNAAAQSLTVEYKLGATGLTDASGWTSVSALTFNSPKTVTGGAIDGNATGNFSAITPATISGVNWTNGQELWVRWVDLNDSGNDHFLAVDSVSFSATGNAAPVLGSTIAPNGSGNDANVSVAGNKITADFGNLYSTANFSVFLAASDVDDLTLANVALQGIATGSNFTSGLNVSSIAKVTSGTTGFNIVGTLTRTSPGSVDPLGSLVLSLNDGTTNSATTTTITFAAVPEPTTLGVLLGGALVALRRRRA